MVDAEGEAEEDGDTVELTVDETVGDGVVVGENVGETVTDVEAEGEGLAAGTMHPGTCPQYAEFKKSMRPACLVAISGSSGK